MLFLRVMYLVHQLFCDAVNLVGDQFQSCNIFLFRPPQYISVMYVCCIIPIYYHIEPILKHVVVPDI